MNIAHWIEHWALVSPDQTAIRFEDRDIGYPEFDAQIKGAAQALKNEWGVQFGDRVAYLGYNHPRMFVLLFACARLGAIFVPLNWRFAPREHLYMLRDSSACVLLVDEPFRAACETLHDSLSECRFVGVGAAGGTGWPALPDRNECDQDEPCHPDAGPDRPVLIVYTSGTTGFPKGAVLTQDSIQYNAFHSLVMHEMTSADRVLTTLPLFHVGGLNNQSTPAFYAGATVLLHAKFDPAAILRAIEHDRATLTIILPAQMPPLRAVPGWEEADFSSLRAVLTGSTTIPDTMLDYWHGRGIPVTQVYGATETCPIAIHQSIRNAAATAGSIGFPAMHCEVRIVDAQEHDCGVGEPGEILVRGKNVMTEYWQDPDRTKKQLAGGWFHSGDIGFVDTAGCYHFLDRVKDVVISGGENIYPAEIENVLGGHPDIFEVAVVGRPDERWGEVPVAVVAVRKGCSLDREQVTGWLEGKLGRYKHPKDVLFVDALPRNALGKVEKPALRDLVNATTREEPVPQDSVA